MTDPNPITRVRVAHRHTAGHATIIAAMSPLGAVCRVTNLDDSARDWINRLADMLGWRGTIVSARPCGCLVLENAHLPEVDALPEVTHPAAPRVN